MGEKMPIPEEYLLPKQEEASESEKNLETNTEEALPNQHSEEQSPIITRLAKPGIAHSLKRGLVRGMAALTIAGTAMNPSISRAEDKNKITTTSKKTDGGEKSFYEKFSEAARNVRVGDTASKTPDFINKFAEAARNVRVGSTEEELYENIDLSEEERIRQLEQMEDKEYDDEYSEEERIRQLEERENYEPVLPFEKKQESPVKKEFKKLEEKNKIKKGEYNMGALEGRSFKDLFSDYLGVEGKTKEKEKIDFAKQLQKIWNKKIERSGNVAVVKKTAETLKAEYEKENKRTMNIEQYESEIQKSINELKLNWDKVAQIKNLTNDERKVLESVSKSIGSKELMAYLFTELFPSSNGNLNAEVMDFLLQNAGAKYVESIPAIYDDKTSFGPYQFTEYAIYDTPKEKRGASIINKAAEGKKIPGSMSKLRSGDHHKAAYLFAINNLANLIKKLDKTELATFGKKWQAQKDGVIEYIATAHHAPTHAVRDAQEWIENGMNKSYSDYNSGALQKYALKTEANLKSLKHPAKKDKHHPKIADVK